MGIPFLLLTALGIPPLLLGHRPPAVVRSVPAGLREMFLKKGRVNVSIRNCIRGSSVSPHPDPPRGL